MAVLGEIFHQSFFCLIVSAKVAGFLRGGKQGHEQRLPMADAPPCWTRVGASAMPGLPMRCSL